MKTGTRWTEQHYNHVVARSKRQALRHVEDRLSDLCESLGLPRDQWVRWRGQDAHAAFTRDFRIAALALRRPGLEVKEGN